MISVFINLRTVDYHLTILTNQLLLFLNKKKIKITNKLLVKKFVVIHKVKKTHHPNPKFGHVWGWFKKKLKNKYISIKNGGLKLTKIVFHPKGLHY
jgi:hypothetical protein